jgi:hypothetical protein
MRHYKIAYLCTLQIDNCMFVNVTADDGPLGLKHVLT